MASSGKRKCNDNEDANDLTVDGINTIYVKTYTGETFSLQVKGSDTIISLKFKIKNKIDLPLDEQALIFNDMVLKDVITLADYRVKKDSTLKLMRKSSGLVPIIINCPTGKRRSFSMNVKLSDTVRDLKAQIPYSKYPHEDKDLVIVFKDIVLADCCILADFHITVNSVLTLMLKSTTKTMESKTLEIFVKTLAGKIISLDVIATTTISQVKACIRSEEYIPEDEKVLIFNDMVLDDSSIIFDFGITKGSTLTLRRVSKGLMQIHVINAVNGKSTSIEVKPSDTIENLKEKINCMERIPVDKQVLMFNEMVLHDSGTLADFHIKEESSLTLMRKSKGSMQIFVQAQCGRKISLEVNPLYTIANLKVRLMEEGFRPGSYELFFDGTRLLDSWTYADHNILEDDVIDHMYEYMGGGEGLFC